MIAPAAVDFDALHAALEDPDDVGEDVADEPTLPAPSVTRGKADPASESSGRLSATYASARPHAIPATRAPSERLNVPAVIVVQADDTVPSGPPQMTMPLAPPRGGPGLVGASTLPPSRGNFAPRRNVDGSNFTVPMPDRPLRARMATVVLPPSGPSAAQRIVAFLAMLVLVIACGIAVIAWRRPAWVGLETSPPSPSPSPTR